MEIKASGTPTSSIVTAGAELRRLQADSGIEYLFLNRGINAVCPINLSEVIKTVDFNSPEVQYYPGSRGKAGLITAINNEYFNGNTQNKNIIVTAGGISGLDVTFQNINVDKVLLPSFFWGTYTKVFTIRHLNYDFYDSLTELQALKNSKQKIAVVICDPNNPLGIKLKDEDLVETIYHLNNIGVITVLDSPYRRVYFDKKDDFYQKIGMLENVIIVESFSKSVGLSGFRTGFVHSVVPEFIEEFAKRILYATNGVNALSQVIIEKLLNSPEGIKAVQDFKSKTVNDISLNIKYLIDHKLIPAELYESKDAMGIFMVVNVSEEILKKNYIGSVPLHYFTEKFKDRVKDYARICVSVPHPKFTSFFNALINKG